MEIYPDRLKNDRILNHIKFHFPAFLNDGHVPGINWDDGETVETVMLFERDSTAQD